MLKTDRWIKAAIVAGLVFGFQFSASAYDGEEDYAEGWTYRVCGLKKAGFRKLSVHTCPDTMCPVGFSLQENDLVFSYGEPIPINRVYSGTEVIRRVTKVESFGVFLHLNKHEAPFGYASANFLCDDATPKNPAN